MSCSPARLACQRKYRASHREEVLALNVAYNATHKEERTAYRDAHREEALAYKATYYRENKGAILEKQSQEHAGFTRWLQIFRTLDGCEDCGTHGGKLEHHHRDPSTKRYQVSQMSSCSQETLEAEIAKCDVLCRSCHKKRHDAMEKTDEVER